MKKITIIFDPEGEEIYTIDDYVDDNETGKILTTNLQFDMKGQIRCKGCNVLHFDFNFTKPENVEITDKEKMIN